MCTWAKGKEHIAAFHVSYWYSLLFTERQIERQRKTETERERERQREKQRERDTHTHTDRDTKRDRKTDISHLILTISEADCVTYG